METVTGRITDISAEGLTVFVPYTNTERMIHRRYDEVEVGLKDGRLITPDQRRKAHALLGEIVKWSGMNLDAVKLVTKQEFMQKHIEGLKGTAFSLGGCDETTAREYISYLIDFMIEFDVPSDHPLGEMCDNVRQYVYSCLTHKRCAVCGKYADLHHVDRVGMGGDRAHMNHIGLRCLPLCREHHQEAHRIGDYALMAAYHLETVPIDKKIAKVYRLGVKG